MACSIPASSAFDQVSEELGIERNPDGILRSAP